MTCYEVFIFFFFQAEDGIRDLVRSRGLGDVYKRQAYAVAHGTRVVAAFESDSVRWLPGSLAGAIGVVAVSYTHLTLPTSDLV